MLLYSPCNKGNLYRFFSSSNITQGWGELFLLVYSCITGSRIRSTAGEPSKAEDGELNWKNTTIFQTLCLPWLQRSQHKLDDVQTVGNGGFTLLESTQTSQSDCELPLKSAVFCTDNSPSCLAPE